MPRSTRLMTTTRIESLLQYEGNLRNCYYCHYVFFLQTSLDDELVKDNISNDDMKAINFKCDEVIKWLDANQTNIIHQLKRHVGMLKSKK